MDRTEQLEALLVAVFPEHTFNVEHFDDERNPDKSWYYIQQAQGSWGWYWTDEQVEEDWPHTAGNLLRWVDAQNGGAPYVSVDKKRGGLVS